MAALPDLCTLSSPKRSGRRPARRWLAAALLAACASACALDPALDDSYLECGSGLCLVWVDDLPADGGFPGAGTQEDPYRDLQYAIDMAPDGAYLVILPGTYHAAPLQGIDRTCGNCSDVDFYRDIPATLGFRIVGKTVHLFGHSPTETILVTHAGYGIYYEGAGGSTITNVTVTGGVRDADGQATDAAIVVRTTNLAVRNVHIVDNRDRIDSIIVGIAGIAAREGAKLTVENSLIENNSWDGIALYRGTPGVDDNGPTARITGNRISCAECSSFGVTAGVGIGATWNSSAVVYHNWVSDYYKGIGAFGGASMVVKNNLLERQKAWGIAASAVTDVEIENNIIADTGYLALSMLGAPAKPVQNNVIIGTGGGQGFSYKMAGLGLHGDETGLEKFRHNLFFDNDRDICVLIDDECADTMSSGSNLSMDPLFEPGFYRPQPGSPLVDSGAPELTDADGSRSDIGLYGGLAGQFFPLVDGFPIPGEP